MGATGFDGWFELGNQRRDVFDSVALTLRQQFRGQYEWMASYTRSRAFSNSVVDVSAYNPTVITENVGRMPWDSPNRFLAWGSFPVLAAYLAVAERITVEALLAAVFAGFLSLAQRQLSTRVRTVRRRVAAVEGTIELLDGGREAVTPESLTAAPEAALRALTIAVLALAASLLVLRLR